MSDATTSYSSERSTRWIETPGSTDLETLARRLIFKVVEPPSTEDPEIKPELYSFGALMARDVRIPGQPFMVIQASQLAKYSAALLEEANPQYQTDLKRLKDHYEALIDDIQKFHCAEFNTFFYGTFALALGTLIIGIAAGFFG